MNNIDSMYTINLIGNSLRVWQCIVTDKLFQDMNHAAQKFNMNLNELIFDLDFLENFGFKHWSEIGNSKEFNFFDLSKRNSIEIKHGKKKILKINSIELVQENLLFPIYNTNYSELIFQKEKSDDHLIILFQKEIGLYGKIEFKISNFDINSLSFELVNNLNFFEGSMLQYLNYEGEILINKLEDTLIQSVFSKIPNYSVQFYKKGP